MKSLQHEWYKHKEGSKTTYQVYNYKREKFEETQEKLSKEIYETQQRINRLIAERKKSTCCAII